MLFGYARVSTHEQNLDLQIDALIDLGVLKENIFCDKISASHSSRTQLDLLLAKLRTNDVLIVWKLDRLARSLIDFTKKMEFFTENKIHFKSITEPFLDTRTNNPHGNLLLNFMAILAQFEKDLIRERTKAGLESARLRGQKLGRPKGISKKYEKKAQRSVKLWDEGILTIKEICEDVKISKATLYKYLRLKGLTNKIRHYPTKCIT